MSTPEILETTELPLSFAQERLWFIDRLVPGSPAYNIPLALELTGDFDRAAWSAALAAAHRRHEALRTTFAEAEDSVVQRIAPAGPVTVPEIDLGALRPAAGRRESERLLNAEVRRPFDLVRGPLLRAAVVALAPRRAMALVTVHHLVADGWSLGVLLEELVKLYTAFIAGRPSPLAALELQYGDYAVWQREWLTPEVLAEPLAHFRAALDGIAPILALPADRPRPAVQSFRGRRTAASLPADLVARLARLGREEGATPFMTLLAGLAALLARIVEGSGRLDGTAIPIGLPVAGRGRTELEDLVGLFVNTVVVAPRVEPAETFREHLRRVRETALAAYAREHLPFEKLVEEMKAGSALSHNPIYQVLFSYHLEATEPPRLPGLVSEVLDFDLGTARVDLALSVETREDGSLSASLELATDLFDPTTGARLLAELRQLLAGAVGEPGSRLGDLSLLGAPERHQLLAEWNDTPFAGDPATDVLARWSARVELAPDAPAIAHWTPGAGIAGGLSFAEVDRAAARLARRLRGLGVGPETRGGILLERSPALAVAMLGLWKAGAAFVPLDPALPDARLAFLIGDGVGGATGADGRVVVTSPALASRLAALNVPDLAAVALDASDGQEALEGSGAEFGVAPTPRAGLAYLIYTSGTTGTPKAVMVEHRSLAHTLAAVAPWFAVDQQTAQTPRMPCLAPFSFDIFLFELLAPVLAGGTAVLFDLQPTLDVAALAAALPSMTHLHAVPALARQLAAAVRRQGPAGLTALRRVYVGGDAVPGDLVAELAAAFPAARLTILYGPTEGTILAAAEAPEAGLPADRRLLGRPLAGARLRLCDAGGGPLPIGVPGEIWLGGPGVARGYLGRPELTAERFVPAPGGQRSYRTGDLARRLPDGRLEFLGRIDQQVKLRGFRIEPAEVEAHLAAHPAVAAVAVALAIPLADQGAGGAHLAAYVALHAGVAASPAELAEHLRARLPAYMVPSAWTAVAELPLTRHGKVDRRALPRCAARPWPAGRGATPYAPPRTPLEERLTTIWTELLGGPPAGVHDDFFARGGHSLLAAQAVARLRDAVGLELPVAALFAAPTPAGLAARIEREAAVEVPPPIVREPRVGNPPLSFAQERLWLLDQLHLGATYNLPFAFDLAGPLDPAAWMAAVAAVRRRHEALRTRFVAEQPPASTPASAPPGAETAAVQVIAPPDLPCPGTALVDLSGLPGSLRAAEAARRTAEEARRPFDLAAGPLLRSSLLRLGAAEHRALLGFHHIVSDGWSTGVLIAELEALYGACEARRPSPLPPLPVQYADYAIWQRRWLSGPVLERQLAHWRGRLPNDLALELPGDRPRLPPGQGAMARGAVAGATLPAEIPPALAGALAALGRGAGATPFMVLLAALASLLHRLTGRGSIAVGAPIANRDRAEIEGLIGFFVNTLVLVADFDGAPTFAELLDRVRQTALDAYAHQDLPFEKLVAEIRPERRLDGSPLFRVNLSLNAALPPFASGGAAPVRGTVRELHTGTAMFDLSLALAMAHGAGGGGLAGAWEYRTDLFDRTTAARLALSFSHLLADAAARPQAPVGRLDLLGEAAGHQLTREWNDTAADFPRTATLAERFARQAARAPEATALAGPEPGEEMSYGELDRRSTTLARRLAAAGAGPEVRVALLLGRSADLVVATLATLKAGGAYVPLDPAYPNARLAFMLEDSRAAILVTHRGLAARLGATGLPTLDLDAPASTGPDGGGGADDAPLPAAAADNLAYVMYTSGSTGVPKGVAATHRNVVRLVEGTGYAAFGAAETFLQLAPTSFDAATFEIWGPLLHGGRLAVPRPGRTTLAEIAEAIRDHGVTTLWLTTGLFHQMVDEELASLGRLSQLLTGGDSLSPPRARAALARLPGTAVVNFYGPTEGTTFSSYEPLRDGAAIGAVVPIGRPIGNARIRVLDARLERSPIGVPGELFVGGDGVARGYLDRPDLTAERFVPDPFAAEPGDRLYRTGDRVRLLPDGRIDFLGRTDWQVKIAGQRIEPGEVEATLARHPLVRHCATAVEGEGAEGKRLVAFAVLEPGAPAAGASRADGGALRSWLAERLPEAMVPARVLLVDRLPVTANGKLDRAALVRLAAGGEDGAAAEHGSPDPVRELLAGLYADLLGRERVNLHDGFFELGGHSLLGTRLVARVRHLFGVELSLRSLFEEPTVAGLAERIRLAQASATAGPPDAEAPPLTAAPRPRGTHLVPASLAQRRLWFLQQLAPDAFFLNVPHALRLRGDLAAPVLARCLGEIVARHEPLRTTFVTADGQPMQRIAPPAATAAAALALPRVDLSGLPSRPARPTREAEARRLARAAAERPFDLARGPLLAALLLRLGPADHLLLLVPHHLVFDGWSMGILFRELAELYGAFVLGHPSPLPPPAVAYADFADWQRRALAGPARERQLAYWRGRLAGLPGLDLPTDRRRPPAPSFRGSFVALQLPPQLAGALAALCRRQGVTLFMAVLAVWDLLLARLSGQRDFPVGAPVAGRSLPETESLIGFFVNTLVLRADLSGEPRVADLLARSRETALGAYGHQDLPFEELVLALKPERHAAVNPLFDVALSLEDAAAPAVLPGLSVEPFDFEADVAHFDLTLVAHRSPAAPGAAITLALNYRRDLFDHTTAARWLEGLATLLAGAAADPEAPAFALPFWPEGARHQVLLEWNASHEIAANGANAATVDRLVARQAALSPDALAIAAAGGRLTYGELAAHAGHLTARLRAEGIGRGARVALVLDRSPELAVAALAVLAAGAAYLPLDPAQPDARLAEILADAAPAAIVARGAARLRLAAAPAPILILDLALDLHGDVPQIATTSPAGSLTGSAAHGAEDLAYLIYTSGSTGRPKGVELAHRGLANLVGWHRERYGLTAADRASWVASPGFDASVWELWPYLAAGASVHLPPPAIARSPRELLAWLAAEAITLAFLPTPLAEAVLRLAGLERPPGLALRALLTGGDRLRQAPAGELGFELVNHYGPTESTVVATACTIAAGPAPDAPPAIGRPLPGLAAYLLDGELRPVPLGARGEICLSGAGLARGYLRRPEQTAERFVPDPLAARGDRLYRTGDLGRFLADGRIEFLGRADGQVKVRGFRVELGEVEARLAAHPEVREAAVVVQPSPAGARLVACLVARQADAAPPATVLREHLRAALPDYMVPAAFVALDALPVTPQGKLDRAALGDLAAASTGAPGSVAAPGAAARDFPTGRLEILLAGLWREVLGMPAAGDGSGALGAEDNFFDLGGQSLALVAVHERLRAELGMDLALVELFEHTTIRSLAARLAGREPAEPAPEHLAAHAERQRSAPAWKERARQARRQPAP